MNNKMLRVGITGAGVFGGYHAAKMVAHQQVDFVGVYDPLHPERAEGIAQRYGAQAVQSREELVANIDALIIASPASVHGRQGLDALKSGLHVLVEKPIATDMETAREMVAIAERKHLVLQVGHQERFVSKAIGLFDVPEKPKRIVAKRVCAFQDRGADVSVTLDLMIHDLELVTSMIGMMPNRISSTTKIGPSGGIDQAKALLFYDQGVEVELLASRMMQAPARSMDLVYPSGSVHVNFLDKNLIHDTPFALNHDFANTPDAADSLGASDNAFVEAVLQGVQTPICGIDGARALHLALEVDRAHIVAADIAV